MHDYCSGDMDIIMKWYVLYIVIHWFQAVLVILFCPL